MLSKIKTKIKNWIAARLQGTHNHYLCYLPQQIGDLSFFILRLFFSGIEVNDTQIPTLRTIPKDAIIVYVSKYKSCFEYLFYFIRYQQEGLPFPEIGFDYKVMFWQPVSRLFKVLLACLDHFFAHLALPDPYKNDYFRTKLLSGSSAFVSLVEEKGFYRRFVKKETDPIQYLLRIQQITERPIMIVPQLMFYSKKPQRSIPTLIDVLFGSEGNPGKLRRLVTLFKNPGNVFVEISEPVNLKVFISDPENRQKSIEHQALVLRRNLLRQMNRHRQSITGPVLKSREELKESILTNEQLQQFMVEYSDKRNIPIHRVHKKAEAYLDEIAAAYSTAIIKIAAGLVGWIINIMFEGVSVDREEINRVKSMYQKGPLILIPCHKSHIDYLILSYIMYLNNMPCPHVAAGKNLSFWPVGPLFRGGGAFFIRRTFKGAVLYLKVFAEYIKKLLEEGFNIELFIEGGRSRTGKLIMPKLGFLSILLNAYKNGACADMVFVPIYIGYDRVLEESSYLNEIEGGQKEPESLMQVIHAGKFLKKRYGRIYIKFHEAISLKDHLDQTGTAITELKPKELNTLCRDLGHRIINAINKVTVVTPHAIAASAILNCSHKRFSHDHLLFHIETLMNHLYAQKAILADTLLADQIHAVEQVIDSYIQQNFIELLEPDKQDRPEEARYMVHVNKRPLLEYYKNNCVAFFIPAAYTALSIITKDAFQFSSSDLYDDFTFLQQFFQYEFAYDLDRSSEAIIRKTIKAFIDDAILMPHATLPDTYNITSIGLRKLKFFAHFLKTYFESYWIVLNYFRIFPQNANNPKDRLKKIQSRGERMYKKEQIELKEALSKVNYDNAVTYFTTHAVKGSSSAKRVKFYDNIIQKYLGHLSR